jgi:hypothetical protein
MGLLDQVTQGHGSRKTAAKQEPAVVETYAL